MTAPEACRPISPVSRVICDRNTTTENELQLLLHLENVCVAEIDIMRANQLTYRSPYLSLVDFEIGGAISIPELAAALVATSLGDGRLCKELLELSFNCSSISHDERNLAIRLLDRLCSALVFSQAFACLCETTFAAELIVSNRNNTRTVKNYVSIIELIFNFNHIWLRR